MEFLDHCAETSAGLIEEVEASFHGRRLVLFLSLVDRIVPDLPAVNVLAYICRSNC